MRDLTCKLHGPAPAASTCRHLATGIACGVHVAPGGERPDAWCDRCDEREHEMQPACVYCYDLAIARNRDVPPHARGVRAVLTVEEHRRLFEHATERLAAIQEAARARWRFDAYARWDFDPDARTLAFTDPIRPTLVTGVRLIGTFATPSTFRWAWAEHDEADLLAAGSAFVRAFGEVRGIAAMTAREWSCRLRDAWELSAVAGYLLGCDGIYRAQIDERYWFLLLTGWRHARRGSTEGGFGPE